MTASRETAENDSLRGTMIDEVHRAGAASLVKIRIHRGQRHQVRAHMAAMSYPLVNDTLYGAREVPHKKGFRLHCEKVVLRADAKKNRREIKAPLSVAELAKFVVNLS
ncbi:MAG: hypothetical protein IPJ88_02605 [Myxococcales bacterium]|nr:MAG: hypothetical protein IPJ88_02605 [Myxococcales bacterium]